MRRWVSRLSLCVLVLLTSLGLVTVQASTAQALQADQVRELVRVVAAAGTAGVRAAPAVSGALGATVCATGVGCLVMGAAVLGIAAYATQDTWVPWVQNLLDRGWRDQPTPAGMAVAGFSFGIATGPPVAGVAGQSSLLFNYSSVAGGFQHPRAVSNADCRAPDGVVYGTAKSHKDFEMSQQYPGVARDGAGVTQTAWTTAGLAGVDPRTHSVESGNMQPGDEASLCNAEDALVGATVRVFDAGNEAAGSLYLKYGVVPDPQAATYDSQVVCKRSDGTEYGVTRSSSPSLQPGTDSGVLLGSCNAGDEMVRGSISQGGRQLTTWDVPASSAEYPNCVGVGASNCTYKIRVNGQECTAELAGCANWAQTNLTSPGTVDCVYGPYVLDLAKCGWMERAYEAGGAPATRANTDGDPATWDAPQPAWQTQPSPTATATATAQPTTSPSPTPTSTATVAPEPSPTPTSTSTATVAPEATPSPTPGPGAAGSPAPSDVAGSECWPSGWGVFNPAEWVLRPIRCALQWAFVPTRAGLDGLTGRSSAAWDAATPARWFAAVGDLRASLSVPAGSCQGPAMTLGAPFNRTFYPASACAEPVASLAAILRAGLSALAVVGGAFACVRLLGAAVGYNTGRE